MNTRPTPTFAPVPAGAANYHQRYGWRTARLRASSAYVVNPNGNPYTGNPYTAGEPSFLWPLPTTDAELVAQGWPSIAGAVDGDLWLCDEAAGSLVGEINGYQLAPQNAPLQNRDFHGLPYGGNLWAKAAVEFTATTTQRFDTANAAILDVTVQDFSFSILVRLASSWVDPGGGAQRFIGKRDTGNGWTFYNTSGTAWSIMLNDGVVTVHNFVLASSLYDGALHLLTGSIDRNGNVSLYVDDQATMNVVAGSPGSLTTGNLFHLGGIAPANIAPGCQVAWVYNCIGVAASRAGHDALWAAMSSNNLGTPNTYTRANPLVVPISASRVACYGAGQLAVGYDAGLVSAALGNALGTGVVAEDGATFEAIGSNDLPTSATNSGGNSHSTIDGPSGMRDAVRVTQGAAWAPAGGGPFVYIPPAGTAIVGASNVAWYLGGAYKRATVGTTAQMGMAFSGSAGGPEYFTTLTDAATPVDWRLGGGTCTPVNADQTLQTPLIGATANADDCDWAEIYLIKNRATAPLAWRRVGTAAAAATSTPTLSYANTGNARFSPVRGTLELIISGFPGTNGATFLDFDAALAGGLCLDYNAGGLRLRIWDATPALAATVLCGPLGTGRYHLRIAWDSRNPVPNVLGQNIAVEQINAGASPTVLGTWAGAWTPPTGDVTPLYVGSLAAGTGAARCFVQLA